MKKWYYWLILTLIWIVAAVINYLDNKSIIGALVVCGVSLLFGLCQYFCDKHGDTGKKVMNYIYISGIILIAVFLAIVVLVKVL